MGSLFDIAAELIQYDNGTEESRSRPGPVAIKSQPTSKPRACPVNYVSGSNQDPQNPIDSLSLVDETLSTIYEWRQPSTERCVTPPLLISKRSVPQLSSSSPRTDKGNGVKSKTPLGVDFKASGALQNVFAHALAHSATEQIPPQRIFTPPPPPPPSAPQAPGLSHAGRQSTGSLLRPDVVAKETLREIQEELKQLFVVSTITIAQGQRLRRSLSEKYLDDRLNKLQSTPFVQLARRKAQQQIDKLGELPSPATQENAPAPPISTVSTFSANQHDMLMKLAHISDSHITKLSATQLNLVQFAKRYSKIVNLPPDQVLNLPVSQTQLFNQLREQYISLDYGNAK